MQRGEALPRVLPLRVGALGEQPRVAPARLLEVVQNRHRGQVDDPPAGGLDADAEVGLLEVQEEPLVEDPGALERLASNEQEGADEPVALELALVEAHAQLALAEPLPRAAQALGREPLAEGAEGVRGVARGRVEAPVGVELLHAGDADVGPRGELVEQAAEGSVDDLGVRVEEERPARVGRLEAPVVRVGEPAVLARHEAHPREVALDHRPRLVVGSVLDDHDVGVHALERGEQRRQAGPEPPRRAGGHDHDRELVHASPPAGENVARTACSPSPQRSSSSRRRMTNSVARKSSSPTQPARTAEAIVSPPFVARTQPQAAAALPTAIGASIASNTRTSACAAIPRPSRYASRTPATSQPTPRPATPRSGSSARPTTTHATE